MSQLSMSADETGSAVVCSGYRGVCRRVGGIVIVQRERGRLALSGGAKSEVLGMKFMVASYELPVSRKDRMGLRDLRRLRLQNGFARKGWGDDGIAAIRDVPAAAILAV